jgi:hypothetical protein
MLNAKGQNYAEMSEYLDFICPMAYHYPAHDRSWVGEVTNFVRNKASDECKVIPTIQAFYEENGKPIIEEPGFLPMYKASGRAMDNNADGINVFIRRYILPMSG